MSTSFILINLAIGPLLLIISLLIKAFPPRKINWAYGYRTNRSRKSQEAWDESNKYANDLMLWVAIATTIAQIVLYFVTSPANALLISCVIMTTLLIAIVVVVENYLKNNFDNDGKKISNN
ncbi:SdpI family protein [Ekhidna sp.]